MIKITKTAKYFSSNDISQHWEFMNEIDSTDFNAIYCLNTKRELIYRNTNSSCKTMIVPTQKYYKPVNQNINLHRYTILIQMNT